MKNLIARWHVQDAIEARVQNTFGRCAIKWFKHDSDASIDAKMQSILLDYGAAGYGLYWYCVELISKDVAPKNITFELEHDARVIARNLNLSVQEVNDMMRKMVEIGLFDINKNNKITCMKLAYRLDDSMRKGTQVSEILNNLDLVGKIPDNSGKSLLDIDKELDKDKDKDKDKDLSSNEDKRAKALTKFVKPSIDDVIDYCKSRNNSVDAEKWFDYYSSNGWKVGKNPMKDWQAAIRTWEKSGFSDVNKQKKEKFELTTDIIFAPLLPDSYYAKYDL